MAIRNISEREMSEKLTSGTLNEKNGGFVCERLDSKHLEGKDMDIISLPIFESCPELINIGMTDNCVKKVKKKMSDSL